MVAIPTLGILPEPALPVIPDRNLHVACGVGVSEVSRREITI